jgi:hypothetical protein
MGAIHSDCAELAQPVENMWNLQNRAIDAAFSFLPCGNLSRFHSRFRPLATRFRRLAAQLPTSSAIPPERHERESTAARSDQGAVPQLLFLREASRSASARGAIRKDLRFSRTAEPSATNPTPQDSVTLPSNPPPGDRNHPAHNRSTWNILAPQSRLFQCSTWNTARIRARPIHCPRAHAEPSHRAPPRPLPTALRFPRRRLLLHLHLSLLLHRPPASHLHLLLF